MQWHWNGSQQLKTVMENCGERIPAGSRNETYGRSTASSDPSSSYLPPPPFDCHSHNIDDKDYAVPSTPVIPFTFI